ncbi:hypothetical protein NEFER03_1228 [Nematocida sp. LUAm3]|nr:hypothetical protein NEFER03_1228 [Nematocida sp. LUAm3]KAI5175837.1 hypothetical protein NEFER02_1706 [Nematocida sp. LUAm2]KAI5178333.1 hypothetical protein NEFER01_1500 [Nematocida sp. LUAm1]
MEEEQKMKGKKKVGKSLWSQIKKSLKELVLPNIRKNHLQKEPVHLPAPQSRAEYEDEELIMAVERLEEEENLLLQTQYPFRSLSLEKVIQHIEDTDKGDEEKVSFFVQKAHGPLLNWWNELPRKPATWRDLKTWLREDMKSISETIYEGKHHIDQEDLFSH